MNQQSSKKSTISDPIIIDGISRWKTKMEKRRNRGALRARDRQEFAINKEVLFLCEENALFSYGNRCPQSGVPPPVKFEMLPTSLERCQRSK